MKKFLDRYLFSRLGLQMLFSVVAIALFALLGTLIRNWATDHTASDIYSQVFWGFRQITDGGSMAGTLDGLDEVATESKNVFAAPVVLVIALVSWLIGMVLYGQSNIPNKITRLGLSDPQIKTLFGNINQFAHLFRYLTHDMSSG